MKTKSIEICFVATGDYAPFVATTALSIIENTSENIHFHVLTENFKEEDKRIIVGALRATPYCKEPNIFAKIIHYTAGKPWICRDFPMSEIFWEYAKKTPYFQSILDILEENIKGKKHFSYLKFSDLAPLLRKQLKEINV